jgi:hypothetical protein
MIAPGGRLVLTQAILRQHLAAKARTVRLMSLIDAALRRGARVQEGALDAAIFEESDRRPNWREEFVALGGDPKAVLDRTEPQSAKRPRVWHVEDKKPGGKRITH